MFLLSRLVAGVSGSDGIEAGEAAVAAEDAQSVVKGWAKWREADAEADEAEEFGWLATGRFEQFIECVLEILGGPIVDALELSDGLAEDVLDFAFGELL